MPEQAHPVRDFLLYLEKTLKTRRLYAPHMAPYREASVTLFDKFQAAAGDDGFVLRIGATDLYLDKGSVMNRDHRDESFFFPLYRDGLRELNFSPELTVEDIEQLLRTFEAESKGLIGPSQDTVSFLWRCDLQGATFKAIDGIGTEEGEDAATSGDEYGALVADLLAKIQNPAPAEGGQSYSFVMDADVQVAATDLNYDASTLRKPFEDNLTILRLTPEEANQLRATVGRDDEETLLGRFMEILISILMDPTEAVASSNLIPVFRQLLEGFWQAADYRTARALLERLNKAAQEAPRPETRETVGKLLRDFLTAEQLGATLEGLESEAIDLADAEAIWSLAIEEAWSLLLEFHRRTPEGELKTGLRSYLIKVCGVRPELARSLLTGGEADPIQDVLAILDESLEKVFASDLLALSGHPDEAVRLKCVTSAGRLQTPEALKVLWAALESDPARPVRLLAFRLMPTANFPRLPERLTTLVTAADFASRPAWERQKYVRLLGEVGGDQARQLFESWIPDKRWLWGKKELEQAELALHGLAARGQEGLYQVKDLGMQHPKLVPAAKAILTAAVRGSEPGSVQ
jgi:hypothetical protein